MKKIALLIIILFLFGCSTQPKIKKRECVPEWSCDKTLFSDKYIFESGDYYDKYNLDTIYVKNVAKNIARKKMKQKLIKMFAKKNLTTIDFLKIETMLDLGIKKDYCKQNICTSFIFLKKSEIKLK